jgi:hypothetical protein
MLIEPILFNEQGKYFQIKINAGQNIFKSGGVIKLTDLEYIVTSATTQGEKYKVFFNYDENRFNCTCKSFEKIKKYNNIAGHCKHIFSVMESLGLIQ